MKYKAAFCGDLEADNAHFNALLTLPACRDLGRGVIFLVLSTSKLHQTVEIC